MKSLLEIVWTEEDTLLKNKQDLKDGTVQNSTLTSNCLSICCFMNNCGGGGTPNFWTSCK